MKAKICFVSSCLAVALTLTGCVAPVIVGTAVVATGTTVSTITDRRSTGAVVNDEILEKRIPLEIAKVLKGVDYHLTVTAYNGRVLLTGEMPSNEAKELAQTTAQSSLDVGSVCNELSVQENVGVMQRISDSSLATKVRSRLISDANVSLNQMKVTVDRGIVYLMGIVSPDEKTAALDRVAQTSGVVKVISFFEIMSAEEVRKMLEAQEQARKLRQEQEENENN